MLEYKPLMQSLEYKLLMQSGTLKELGISDDKFKPQAET